MTLLIGFVGALLITVVLWDVFETIVLPRRVTRRVRLTRLFYRFTWRPWRAIARAIRKKKRRETFLGIYGPLSLLVLLTVWAASVVFGFALLHWAIGSRMGTVNSAANFFIDFYYSGTTFFTLGLGDVTPLGAAARAITVIEASIGFGLLALVIGYLPVLYQAFSRREVNISMLDARAGTPPTAVELLGRHQEAHSMPKLDEWLRDWEMWAADLMESHLSYPALCFFRSQHDNQSWLAALSTVLDVCSLVMVGIDGVAKWQAQLTFKMARHALVDISQIFNTSPLQHDRSRMTDEVLAQLRVQLLQREVTLSDEPGDNKTLEDLRALYEPYTQVLSRYLIMSLPEWLPKSRTSDNWQTSAFEIRSPAPDQPFKTCMLKPPTPSRVRAPFHKED
ncbi:MAG TPA: two pore domain potassium channel family protein [Blastocatellia bacterium]|nr:two pore domain potassium channel family protein [Blastocatellia bacterium]